MSARAVLDPYGSNDLLATKMLGGAYSKVRTIAERIDAVTALYDIRTQLNSLNTNLAHLVEIAENIDHLTSLAKSLQQLLAMVPGPLTSESFATWFASLPTSLPDAAGEPWNNGGVLSFS